MTVPRTPRLTPSRIEASYGITGEAEGASWPATEEKLKTALDGFAKSFAA